MPLPFKEENLLLPNNRPQAEQRLSGLKKRFEMNEKYCADHVRFMSGIITKGYAQKIEQENSTTVKGRVWYLPHHGIYIPHKPDKIRVVFDFSTQYEGESLNDHLFTGT